MIRAHRGRGASPALVILVALAAPVAWPEPATGAMQGPYPEPQSRRLGAGVSPSLSSFAIYAESDDVSGFWALAQYLALQFPCDTPCAQIPVLDLDQLGQNPALNQIVIGNPAASPGVQLLAIEHGGSTLDLGTEGYWVCSEVPPSGSCGWRVLLIANDPDGGRHGVTTLLQELMPPQQTFREVRIRDHPDRPQRGYLYSLSTIGVGPPGGGWMTVPEWMSARMDDLDHLASLGINTVYFQSGDWFRLDAPVDVEGGGSYPDPRYGARLRELFDHCRSLRMEPVPLVGLTNLSLSGIPDDPQHALWREGKLVQQERFVANQGQLLASVIGNFSNASENLDWHCYDPVTALPCQWTRAGSGPNTWNWDGATRRLVLSGYAGGPGTDAQIKTTVPVVKGSFYVLRVTLNRIDFEIPDDCPPGHNCRPNIYARDAGEEVQGDPWIKFFYLRDLDEPTADSVVYECPFSPTDPQMIGHEIDIVVSTNEGKNVSLEVSSVGVDRRDAGFINLMRDVPTSFGGRSYPGLGVAVVSDDESVLYREGPHYVIEPDPRGVPLDWMMPSEGPASRIRWCASTPPGTIVRVTSTLGVPADHPGGNGNASTWCFSHGSLYAEYDRMFRSLYGGSGFGLNPRLIHMKMDEVRGMNRCGRCVLAPGTAGRGLENDEYLLDYINEVQRILAAIPGAEQARVVAFADMLSPTHNGKNADDQYRRWMGQMGSTAVDSSLLDDRIILHLWEPERAASARARGWPGSGLQVVAGPYTDDDPETWAQQATWYETDALGYALHKYSRYALPSASDARMLDYAWKRYAHPDATLQGFVGNEFRTDDVGDHVVLLSPGQPLTVRPYGRAEKRNLEDCGGSVIQSASINWGDGTPVTTVQPSQLNSASFNHTFTGTATRTITLTVTASPCTGQGGPQTAQARIRARVVSGGGGGCTKNCPTESDLQLAELTTGIRAVKPNPFGAAAAIHFSTAQACEPQVQIFDVQGRRMLEQRLAEHPPGTWQWTWDGMDDDGHQAVAGVYFVQLRLGAHLETRRLVKLAR
jgi:hypothetical protein